MRIAVMKPCLCLTIAAWVCIALPLAAQTQGYPARPIRSIMTVAGGADIVARLVAQGLTGALGQPVVVETQSGAGGAIGAEAVARAAPDGYTIMLTSASALVMNRFLSKSARLDPLKDFTPITKAFETVALVVTSPALPVGSMRDLVEYAKRHPGKLSYGTSGIGTTHHLSGESIRLLTGIDWVHVPYKGGPPVITDLIGGEIQVGFSILATAAPFLASGKIRVIAVNGAKRYHVIPNVPVVAEELPGCESRGHRFSGGDEHARGAHRHHPPRHRVHVENRHRDRDQAGIAMAGKLRLSMMIGDYEIVRPLKDGTVKPKGIELLVADYPGTRHIHDKVASGEACDINEFNGGAYVVQKHNGRDDFTALPVFLHRRFRHGFIYINRSKGIERPTDLVGRRVACRTLGAAANYW
ncbi:MAG: hypothetical protein E6H59_11370, partial [Betaproteobacteria bacterium]